MNDASPSPEPIVLWIFTLTVASRSPGIAAFGRYPAAAAAAAQLMRYHPDSRHRERMLANLEEVLVKAESTEIQGTDIQTYLTRVHNGEMGDTAMPSISTGFTCETADGRGSVIIQIARVELVDPLPKSEP